MSALFNYALLTVGAFVPVSAFGDPAFDFEPGDFDFPPCPAAGFDGAVDDLEVFLVFKLADDVARGGGFGADVCANAFFGDEIYVPYTKCGGKGGVAAVEGVGLHPAGQRGRACGEHVTPCFIGEAVGAGLDEFVIGVDTALGNGELAVDGDDDVDAVDVAGGDFEHAFPCARNCGDEGDGFGFHVSAVIADTAHAGIEVKTGRDGSKIRHGQLFSVEFLFCNEREIRKVTLQNKKIVGRVIGIVA